MSLRRRFGSPWLSEEAGKIAVIGNAKMARPGKTLAVIVLRRMPYADNRSGVRQRSSEFLLRNSSPRIGLMSQSLAPEKPAAIGQSQAHQPLSCQRCEAAQNNKVEARNIGKRPIRMPPRSESRDPKSGEDPLVCFQLRLWPGRIRRRRFHVANGKFNVVA